MCPPFAIKLSAQVNLTSLALTENETETKRLLLSRGPCLTDQGAKRRICGQGRGRESQSPSVET